VKLLLIEFRSRGPRFMFHCTNATAPLSSHTMEYVLTLLNGTLIEFTRDYLVVTMHHRY